MQMEKSQYRQTALVKNHVNSRIKWGLFFQRIEFRCECVCMCEIEIERKKSKQPKQHECVTMQLHVSRKRSFFYILHIEYFHRYYLFYSLAVSGFCYECVCVCLIFRHHFLVVHFFLSSYHR